jgi:hypothetical protein
MSIEQVARVSLSSETMRIGDALFVPSGDGPATSLQPFIPVHLFRRKKGKRGEIAA